MLLLISSATSQTKDKSASPSILFEGVPTVIKIISASFKDFDKVFEKLRSFVLLRCLSNKASTPGSKKGHLELFNSFILLSSLSMQTV